ncbi:NADH-quinone oxidoreductase subunit K [uncultured Hydrogenophaga sp.]|uniref:NADH-quinone oxidoreductase subunit K n=1 Tax=uncultured Hydrogenophaga sp. TaxID=199683 RepID=UPI00265F269E|nr:NADH-quinone oxidoreductase subunit K [uncultured Hydrogenophaga sp.]
MIFWTALTVGVTVAAGTYLALSRDVFRSVMGFVLMGAAVNLALFASGRLGSSLPAVVPAGQQTLGEAANSLPQALVLTAIVIGLALVCFALVLVVRLVQRTGSDDSLALRHAEPEPTDPVKPPESVT